MLQKPIKLNNKILIWFAFNFILILGKRARVQQKKEGKILHQ